MDAVMGKRGCSDDEMCCSSAEFARLRYYFGQHLGVVDFSDAQAYTVGKQRFHNRLAHGAGVLCGLSAERFVFPQGPDPAALATVLRVHRGAALDACGREIVVGTDQCIDVASWFALQRRTSEELQGWNDGETHPLWVALRYRECGSDPTPAPREPCGCDAGGCQFSRVRESFELVLMSQEQLTEASGQAAFPTPADLRAALTGPFVEEKQAGTAGERLERALNRLFGLSCHESHSEPWLFLVRCDVTIGTVNDTPAVTNIAAVDNTIVERRYLLSTAAGQTLLLDAAAAIGEEGLLGPGPVLGELSFQPGAGAAGGDVLRLSVRLLEEGQPAAPVELIAQTLKSEYVKLMRFDPAGPWLEAAPTSVTIQPPADPSAGLQIELASGTLAAGQYRLTLAAPHEAPVVDMKMRPLRPLRASRHFRLIEDAGTLKLADTLF